MLRNKRLKLESLEAREVPAVDLVAVANSEFPTNKPLFVPITVASADGPVSYAITSNSPNVSAQVLTGGRSVQLTVSGKDSSNAAFSGDLTFRLFEDVAPLTTGNIVTLVNAGYYTGKEFHRVVNDFVLQGGSPNGDGVGGSPLVNNVRDEYNPEYTFASRGIVAIANAGDDGNNAQFFITDPFILSGGAEVNAPLDRRSQFLNFNHTIFGILTSGFETYQKIMDVPKVLGNDGAISSPTTDVLITNAKILTINLDGVVKLTALSGFLGAANIQVTATQGAMQQSKSFTVNSVADTVNDRPFLNSIVPPSTTPNTAVNFNLPITELDAGDNPTFNVGRVVNTANGPVFTTLDPAQGTASVNAVGLVTFTPATGFTGSVQVTVGVRDGQDRIGSSLGLNDARNFDTEILTVTVSTVPANNTPTITSIPDQIAAAATTTVNFTVNDVETAAGSLTLTASSNNPLLLPNSGVALGGSGSARSATLTPVVGQFGVATITITVTDAGGRSTTEQFLLRVLDPAPTNPRLVGFREFAAGSDIGGGTATLYNADGTLAFTVTPFGASFLGGIRTAAADVNGDKVADLIVASGPGREGQVRIFDGVNQGVLFELTPFGSDFTRGIVVTAGDLSGDGKAEVVISAESGGGARLRIFSPTAAGFVQTSDFIGLIGSDGVPDGSFRGGARAAVGDINGDGFGDLIFAAGAGGGPRIALFNGKTLGLTGGVKLRGDFFAFEPDLRDGTYVAAGDFDGDGFAELAAGAGPGGGPRVSIFDGVDLLNNQLVRQKDFFAGDVTNRGGIRVAVKNLDGDNKADLLVGAGPGGGSRVTAYTGIQLAMVETSTLFGFEAIPGFNGGVFVG